MESALGTDLSGVRVHTDREAAAASRDISAEAFTSGRDIYFGEGRYQPETSEGRRLIAHELVHTIQQSNLAQLVQGQPTISHPSDALEREADQVADAVVTGYPMSSDEISRQTTPSLQRYSWDEFAGDMSDISDTVSDTVGDITDTITDTALEVALAGAQSLVNLLGGRISITPSGIVIEIDDISLFPSFEKTLIELPPMGFFIPLLGGSAMIGPIPLVGALGILGYAQPSIEAAVGPGVVRNIRILINPTTSNYSATGQLYIAAAIGGRLTLFGGLAAGLGTVIPFDPPIPVILIAQAGLRATGTAWGIGALQSTLTLAYSTGRLTFNADNDLMVGLLLQGDLDFFAALRLYEKIVCQYVHPINHWETGWAYKFNIPIHAGLGGGRSGTIGVGPITAGPMPIQDIITAIHPLPTGWSCLSWEEIIWFLCENELIPPEYCEQEEGEEVTGMAGSCVANDNLGETADSFISRCRKASIRREFPSELLQETLGNIKGGKSARHKKAWKLLNDNRFKKPGADAAIDTLVVPAGVVRPTSNITVHNNAGKNECLPNMGRTTLSWNVVSADVSNWGVNVIALQLYGDIWLNPWPSQPTSMVVPNTANPVDGGNINNTSGSRNNWQFVIDDMADYDTSGSGGAGAFWHSTEASRAHEYAHWNGDHLADAVMSNAGGDWPKTNSNLDALREPKSNSPDDTTARRALQPRIDSIMAMWQRNVINRWNHLIRTTDKPGAGGRGYAAGLQVLNELIKRVRAYKDSKGW